MCVDGKRVFGGRARIVLVKSEFKTGGFFPSPDDWNKALNVLRAWRTEERRLREQSISAGQEFEAQKDLLSRAPLIRVESDGKVKVWAGKVLLLFRCLVKEESGGEKLPLVHYLLCLPPLDETD